MSKDSHSFSVSVACEVGVPAAILLQHFCFIQKTYISQGENWQLKWVKRSAASIAKTYPYWSAKQVSAICDGLEKNGYIFSIIENSLKTDRTKSFLLSPKGLHLIGEIPFAQMENGNSKKANANAETENYILPNGEMLIKVDCNSFVDSFVEGNAGANAPLAPPFKKVGEIETVEAEKEKEPSTGAAGAIRVSLADPETPGVTIHDEIQNVPEPKTPPVKTGREAAKREQLDFAQKVLDEINVLKGGRAFRINEGDNAKEILARRKEGATFEEMKSVVSIMWKTWGHDAEMRRCFNPTTLFRKGNFWRYLTFATDAATMPKPAQPQKQTFTNQRSQINHFGGESQQYDEKQVF